MENRYRLWWLTDLDPAAMTLGKLLTGSFSDKMGIIPPTWQDCCKDLYKAPATETVFSKWYLALSVCMCVCEYMERENKVI